MGLRGLGFRISDLGFRGIGFRCADGCLKHMTHMTTFCRAVLCFLIGA